MQFFKGPGDSDYLPGDAEHEWAGCLVLCICAGGMLSGLILILTLLL